MIVFVDPPSPPGFIAFRHSHGGFGENCKTSRLKFPTLDLFHAASLLLAQGHEASVVDSVLLDHSPEACVDAILAKRPTRVVMRTSSGSCGHDLAVAGLLRSRFEGPIAFSGPHAFVEKQRILASGFVDALESEPALEDIERLEVPRWDLVDYKRYSYVTSQTSWGCPFRCGYCPYPVTQGAEWRTRSNASVVREFQALRDRYGLRFVLLRDPEFTLKRERTVSLCRALIKAGTPMMWGCETRLDTLDEGLIAMMGRAGCVRVAFGVDSVNPDTLALMKRRFGGKDEIREKVEALKRAGILTYGMYIVGLPGETRETTEELIDFALELETNAASFSMATPFPGTELERLGRAQGTIEAEDPLRLTGCVPSMRTEAMGLAEVERLYLGAKKRWNERKGNPAPRPLSSALSSRL